MYLFSVNNSLEEEKRLAFAISVDRFAIEGQIQEPGHRYL
jgi:hypothetical protein